MKESGVPDSLTVINGPEDGAEFSIVRVPAAIGQDPSCSILIRLDRLVQPIHAHLTAVSEGYRVRCATRAPVWVNGLRGGRARSRILRHGDRLTIGNTELILECAPDGLAHRSRGISTDGDLLWAVKRGVAGVAAIAAGVFGWVIGSLTAFFSSRVVVLLIVVGILLVIWPAARYWVVALATTLLETAGFVSR